MAAQRSLINRRQLIELGALCALPAVVGCRKRDRASVLSGLVTEVVLGMACEVQAHSKTLHAELRALSSGPSLQRQRAAQLAFERATSAWKQAYAFRCGPFVASEAFQHAVFWPARVPLIEGVLADDAPIDERRVEQLGVDARGLYALEYLLFDAATARSSLLAADVRGERVRNYSLELATNILGYAERIQRLLGNGRAYAESFAGAGKLSVDALASQTIDTLAVVSGKFARVQRAASENRPLPLAVEGYLSKSSLAIVLAIVGGSKKLYLGGGSGGLSALVACASPAIDKHVRAAYGEAERRLRAIEMPIEAALDRERTRFDSALAAVLELRHVMEVEMVAALSS